MRMIMAVMHYLSYLLRLLVFMIELNWVYGDISPSVSKSCPQDCTLAEHLPCKIQTVDYECQPSKYPTSLWPGPPGYLPYNITYHIIGNKCVASPRLQWMIPNDSSAKSVKGFELTVINMKGDYLNYRVCVTFDLSKATWRDSDIRNGLIYNYTCILLSPGEYYISIYSLPKPQMGAIDRMITIPSVVIPEAYIQNGSCIVQYPTTRVVHRTALPTSSLLSQTTVLPTNAPPSLRWPQWTGVGLGIISGLLFIILMVFVVRRCSRRRPEVYLINNVPDPDDPELCRPPSFCGDEDTHLDVDATLPGDAMYPRYQPPIKSDDIGSNISSLVGHINQSEQ